jgi:DENN domain-containing protein 5
VFFFCCCRRSPRRRDNTSLSATDVTQPATRVYCRATDTLYCTRCICIISRIPLVVTFERILRSLYGGATGEKLSSFIGALTNLLYDIPLPLPGTSLRISLLSGTHICQRPGLVDSLFFLLLF